MSRFLVCLLAISLHLFAEKQTICLNMIVKDEEKVIARCLDSVKSAIDYWVIVDTGSSDRTIEVILECLKGIPGELYESSWRDFGANRTEACELARGKADYLLFMDADDWLVFDGELPTFTTDMVNLWRGAHGFSYHRPQFARGDLPWKFVGVTHEFLTCDRHTSSTILEEIRYVDGDGGARSHGIGKFLRNIELLENGLQREPNNSRYAFYLAESYRDAGEPAKALQWYQKRIDMGGWAEEVFWSMFNIARLLQQMQLPFNIVVDAYLNAIDYRPHRIEPVYHLAEYYNEKGLYRESYDLIKASMAIERPDEKDVLFNMDWIEEEGHLLFKLSIAAHYVGEYREAIDLCDRLLAMDKLPEWMRERTLKNRTFPLAKLGETQEKDLHPKPRRVH